MLYKSDNWYSFMKKKCFKKVVRINNWLHYIYIDSNGWYNLPLFAKSYPDKAGTIVMVFKQFHAAERHTLPTMFLKLWKYRKYHWPEMGNINNELHRVEGGGGHAVLVNSKTFWHICFSEQPCQWKLFCNLCTYQPVYFFSKTNRRKHVNLPKFYDNQLCHSLYLFTPLFWAVLVTKTSQIATISSNDHFSGDRVWL